MKLRAWCVPALLAATTAMAKDVATFSIVAVDPKTGEAGVAVASKFFAVGAVVPWAKGGVGAVATQPKPARPCPSGPRGWSS